MWRKQFVEWKRDKKHFMQQTFIPKVKILHIPLKSRKKVAEGTTEVTLDTAGTNFTFKAGQYIRITIPLLSPDVPGGNTRDFTISSSPNAKDSITITFRESDSAFKKMLLEVPENSMFTVQGPLGVFTLPENQKIPVIFIAGGIGITTALSMVRFISEEKSSQRIHLVYVNASIKRAAHVKELRMFAKRNPNFILTEKIGRVDAQFLKEHTKNTPQTLWYICGQTAMVMYFTKTLPEELDISEFNIRTEEYVGYERTAQGYKVLQPVGEKETAVTAKEEEKILNKRIIQPLLDAASQAALVAVTDIQGTILYVNQKFIDVAKYSREELIGQNHRILKSGFHSPKFYKTLWKTISNGNLWRGEIKNRAKDGTFYWVDTSITPIFGSDKEIESYIAVRFLITDKKDLEESKKEILNILEDVEAEKEKVEEAKSKNEALLASIGDGIFATDTQKRIMIVNRSAEEMLGWREQEAIGKDLFRVVTVVDEKGDVLPRNDRLVQLALRTGKKTSNSTYSYVRKDGTTFPVAVTASPVVLNKKIIGAIIVFRDITKEKEMDRAKSEFVLLASHQLRTPLSSLNWYIEMVLEEEVGKLTPDQKKYLEKISHSSRRMTTLVDALLNVSRIEMGTLSVQPKPIYVQEIAKEVVGEFAALIEQKRLKFKTHYDDMPVINVDPDLTRIIFENLLSNAIHYTPEKGDVTLTVTKRVSDVLITVADTGYGIPKQEQNKIFTKLFRAENIKEIDTDGTGLGLYIVKAIVELARGKVWFESTENKGSVFYATIPFSGMKPKKGTERLGIS